MMLIVANTEKIVKLNRKSRKKKKSQILNRCSEAGLADIRKQVLMRK